jgi:hypothetical protein
MLCDFWVPRQQAAGAGLRDEANTLFPGLGWFSRAMDMTMLVTVTETLNNDL